jgi:hypothetical protein
MNPRQLPLLAAALAATTLVTACGSVNDHAQAPRATTAPRTTPTAPPALSGASAHAAGAVDALARAVRDGDVARLCRPNDIFTRAVIVERRRDVVSCEAWVENLLASHKLAAPTVVRVAPEPALAVARVRVANNATTLLTLLRDRHRWLVSFSAGDDPLDALSA